MKIADTKLKRTEFARQSGIHIQNLKRWFRQPKLKIQDHHASILQAAFGLPDGAAGFYREIRIAREVAENSEAWDAVERAKAQIKATQVRRDRDGGFHPSVPVPTAGLPEIPQFDLSLSAGPWADVQGVGEVYRDDQIEWGLFRVRIAGDSMQPDWKDGSIVEFKCHRMDRDALAIGEDYYIQRGDLATFKRLEKIGEDELIFRAVNRRKYPSSIEVPLQEISRMGKAIGVFVPRNSR